MGTGHWPVECGPQRPCLGSLSVNRPNMGPNRAGWPKDWGKDYTRRGWPVWAEGGAVRGDPQPLRIGPEVWEGPDCSQTRGLLPRGARGYEELGLPGAEKEGTLTSFAKTWLTLTV